MIFRHTTGFWALFIPLAFLISSCGGDDNPSGSGGPAENRTATLELAIETTGSDVDEDGYTVVLNGGKTLKADTVDTISVDVEPGSHEVEIRGVSSNCSVKGDNPRQYSLSEGVTRVSRTIACAAVADDAIIYERNYELYSMHTNGSNPRQITYSAAAKIDPAVSPDGMKIAYTHVNSSSGERQIHVMNADGSGDAAVTDIVNQGNYGPAWSPDGERIAFSGLGSNGTDIYLADKDGANLRRIDMPGSQVVCGWLPGGDRLLLMDFREDPEIYTMNVDGTGLVRLTDNTYADDDAALSHDGKKVAFAREVQNNWDIYTMNIDGTGLKRITMDSDFDVKPTWSPDDAEIVFVSDRNGSNDIFKINADGSGSLMNLTNTAAIDEDDPHWSPVK
ncbi:PD40 domain-containing protein [Fodinibius sediminis]|nr:PD40 domain-containing protein [Fodinibius sediminis]